MTAAVKKHKPEALYKATPLTLLFDSYNCKTALDLKDIAAIDLKKQMEILQRDNISTTEKRQITIQDLITAGLTDLEEYVNIRINIKSVLGEYYRDSYDLRTSKTIEEWNEQQMLRSFLFFLIQSSLSDKKTERIWEFAYYLKLYFINEKYDGKRFMFDFNKNLEQLNISGNNNNNSGYSKKGFGLQMMKSVCAAYSLKSGPFSKVKKKCNLWASELYQQSQGNKNVSSSNKSIVSKQLSYGGSGGKGFNPSGNYSGLSSIPKKPPHNYSKFVTDVSMFMPQHQVVQQQFQPTNVVVNADAIAGKLWYWLFDNYGNNLKWMPYKTVDNDKLNASWLAGQASCSILNGSYRVDFTRNGTGASGTQYNTQMQKGGGRNVICHVQTASIHDVPVAENPM